MSEAIHRYHTAKSYFQSSIMIERSPERNSEARKTMTLLPMSMLVGFALELYFKAWLLAAGRPSLEVQRYGHRMKELYAEARKDGLPLIPKLDEMVAAVSAGHEDFSFRYIKDGKTVNTINWEAAFLPLDELDTVVDRRVGASASCGLVPGHSVPRVA